MELSGGAVDFVKFQVLDGADGGDLKGEKLQTGFLTARYTLDGDAGGLAVLCGL